MKKNMLRSAIVAAVAVPVLTVTSVGLANAHTVNVNGGFGKITMFMQLSSPEGLQCEVSGYNEATGEQFPREYFNIAGPNASGTTTVPNLAEGNYLVWVYCHRFYVEKKFDVAETFRNVHVAPWVPYA